MSAGDAITALPRLPLAGVLLAGVLLAGVLLTGALGCSTSSGPSASSAPPTTATSSSAAPASDPATALCQRFNPSAATLRGVLETARQGPVLGPALYLLLLSPRNIAATPGITDPELTKVLPEFIAALDELATQAEKKLPPGADPATTPVQLDSARASAALTAAESACQPRLAGIVPTR